MSVSNLPTIPSLSIIAALAIAPVAPEASNTIFLAAGAIGLLLMWPRAISELPRPIIWMPLVGLVLTGMAYAASSGLEGLAGLLYFVPMLAILPLVTLLRGTDRQPYSDLIGLLAFTGVVGAAVMALVEVQTTGTARAGTLVANQIHFADTALMVGFAGLVGVIGSRGKARAIYLLSPVVAVVPVLLSGARGAVIAVVAMFAVLALTAALARLVPRRLVLAGSLTVVVVAAIALVLGANQLSGVQRVLTNIIDTATGAPADYTTGLRLRMYLGAFRAFLEAPIFGHGPLVFTEVANRLVDGTFSGTPHLHNDLADMAASAGLFGLVAYLLFVLAPIVEALRAPPSLHRAFTIVLAVTLVTGFFVMGLTNAMFGILTLTTTFAAICVIIGFLCSPQTGPDIERQAALPPPQP